MKKLLYLILLFSGFANATDIVFTDPAFKAKLLLASTANTIAKNAAGVSIAINTNGDSEISEAEAAMVYSLDVSTSTILSNIVGIKSFVNLVDLKCNNNSIDILDVSGMANLVTLNCFQNTITTLDVTSCNAIVTLNCKNNLLTTINVSTCTSLVTFNCSNNSLQTLFVKNGRNETITLNGATNSGLQYICADESQVAALSGGTYIVNSNCTITPGGNYTLISGTISYDNLLEVAPDYKAYVKVICTIGSQVIQTISDNDGLYQVYTTATTGNYTLTRGLENNDAFLATASITNDLSSTINNNDFVLYANTASQVPDLEVVVAPITPALPGQNATYEVVYKNKGSKKVDGFVDFNFDNSKISYLNSTATAPIITTSQVRNLFTNLLPLETRSFQVTLNFNPTTAPSFYAIGETANFSVDVNESTALELTNTLQDNTFSYDQIVQTYTPNNFKCLEGNTLNGSLIGEYLHYVINFENSGSQVVNNVVVKNTFDPAIFDMNSIQILKTSHPLDIKIVDNNVDYFFNNAGISPPGGHGGILLKIKTLNNLTPGTTINNNAQIFFDYAAPITTPTEASVVQALGVTENNVDKSIKIYPNPTHSVININGDFNIQSIQLYDIQGRLLQTNLGISNEAVLDISDKSNGIYFVKITSDKGIKVEKIIKE